MTKLKQIARLLFAIAAFAACATGQGHAAAPANRTAASDGSSIIRTATKAAETATAVARNAQAVMRAMQPAHVSIAAQHGGNDGGFAGIAPPAKTPPASESKLFTIILAIAMLSVIFIALRRWGKKKPQAPASEDPAAGLAPTQTHQDISGEVSAAISAALYELNETRHDTADATLTIRPVNPYYSPWGSKSLTLKRSPRK